MEADILARIALKKKHSSPHSFIHGDFFQIHNQLEPSSFDVIITDPPYGMGADDFGSLTTKHHYSDDPAYALSIGLDIIRIGHILTKPDAFLFLFCDIDAFHQLRSFAEEWGWKPWRTPLIWNKEKYSGIEPVPGAGFFRSYELILYARKGNRVRGDAMSDVIPTPPISIPGHSSAKPPDLYRILLSRSGNPGDHVLDPCCGVGTVFHAARALNWIATGVELDDTCANLCKVAALGV
jgi:DNA modification methylase